MDVQDIIEALPSTASAEALDSDKLRTALVSGVVGIIPADTSVVANVLQIDPADAELGGVRQAYVYGTDAGIFVYDPLDDTTAQDLIFCLVLIGGRRYKRVGKPAIGTVISRRVETPPDPANSPPGERNFGDAYLNLGGGGWAAEGIAVNSIALWSSLGGGSWQEVEPAFGPPVYVQDEDGFVRWTGGTGWQAGLGANSIQDGSIQPEALIWDGRVQNQTLTALPANWTKGQAWIVGASATGALAGQDGKIALALADGTSAAGDTLHIFAPGAGRVVYDIAKGIDVRWSGTAWRSANGAVVDTDFLSTTAANTPTGINGTSGYYTYKDNEAPDLGLYGHSFDSLKILQFAAKRAGARIRLRYQARAVMSSSGVTNITIYVRRDNETVPVDHVFLPGTAVNGAVLLLQVTFEFAAADINPHDYQVGFTLQDAGATGVATLGKRHLRIEEFA